VPSGKAPVKLFVGVIDIRQKLAAFTGRPRLVFVELVTRSTAAFASAPDLAGTLPPLVPEVDVTLALGPALPPPASALPEFNPRRDAGFATTVILFPDSGAVSNTDKRSPLLARFIVVLALENELAAGRDVIKFAAGFAISAVLVVLLEADVIGLFKCEAEASVRGPEFATVVWLGFETTLVPVLEELAVVVAVAGPPAGGNGCVVVGAPVPAKLP
jgi:hypothetical protein